MHLHRYPAIHVGHPQSTREEIQKLGIAPLQPEMLALPTTAPSYSIQSKMTPARNQGMGPCCTVFACTAALEYIYYNPTGPDVDLSEGELADYAFRAAAICPNPDAGVSNATCLGYLRDHGIATEDKWPYDQTHMCSPSPPNVSGFPHSKFRTFFEVYYRPTSEVLDNMRAALSVGIFRVPAMPPNFIPIIKNVICNGNVPAIVSIPVWWESSGHFACGWESGPDIQMPSPVHLQLFLESQKGGPTTPPNVDGWHDLAICGYDDTKGRLTFKNSWAFWWGANGFGTLPYDYITQFSRDGWCGTA